MYKATLIITNSQEHLQTLLFLGFIDRAGLKDDSQKLKKSRTLHLTYVGHPLISLYDCSGLSPPSTLTSFNFWFFPSIFKSTKERSGI